MKNDELMHYGRKGMKWGQHIYQKADGSYTRRGAANKKRAVAGLRKIVKESQQEEEKAKKYHDINKKALDTIRKMEKDAPLNAKDTWNKYAIEDAYKATGRNYLTSVQATKLYSKLLNAYETDQIKAGEDYISKWSSHGLVTRTESGAKKEDEIAKRVYNEMMKKYRKEIKEYGFDD